MTRKFFNAVMQVMIKLALLPIAALLWRRVQTYDENFHEVLGFKQYAELFANPWYRTYYKTR